MTTKVKPLDSKAAWTEDESDVNVSTLWTDFTQNTGFHGVNKLTAGRNYRIRCFWWTIAVLAMAGYMSYTITKELINYYKYPTVTSFKVEFVEELDFPAVTICNQSPFSINKAREADPDLVTFLRQVSSLGRIGEKLNWDNFTSPTFRESMSAEWWHGASIDLDESFYQCMMKGSFHKPCSIMKPVLTRHGLCATLNHNASDVTKIQLPGEHYNFMFYANIMMHDYVMGSNIDAGLKVYLHTPGEDYESATTRFVVSPGRTTFASISKYKFKYLPHPYKAFGNLTCVDTNSPTFNNTLEFFEVYTHHHCIKECLTKQAYQSCGCSAPGDHESLKPICSIYNRTVCHDTTIAALSVNTEFLDSCDCKIACSFDSYDVKVSTSAYPSDINMHYLMAMYPGLTEEYFRKNFLELRIYYDSLITTSTEQVAQYTTETVIGNLGGQMGICLGASFLTMTELGEFFVILCLTVFKRVTRAGKIKNRT